MKRSLWLLVAAPLLATVFVLPAAAALKAKPGQAADARVLHNVTLHEKGVSLADFCADLQAKIGVELTASRAVADEKVTVFVKDRPARGVMREVARLFGDFWVRSGHAGEYRYELDQDLRSQLAEEELRNHDLDAALVALDAQMQKYRPYLDMSIEELKKLYDQSRANYGLLFPVVYNASWAGMQLYFCLTPADRAALAAGQELVFRPDDPSPDRRFPAEWNRPILQTSVGEVEINGQSTHLVDVPGIKVGQVRLTLTRSELGQVSLDTTMSAAWPGQFGPTRTRAGGKLALGRSPSVTDPDNSTANAALRGRPPLDRVISVRPKPSCPALKSARAGDEDAQFYSRSLGGSTGQPHVFSGDVWEAVHRATGLPIIADYYTRMYRLDKLVVDQKPLFDALCAVGDALGVRWTKDGEFLLCHSSSYFWDKLKEVPNRYLQHWTQERDTQGGLPLEDFLEMAQLQDPQLDSTVIAEAIEHCWGLRGWWLVSNPLARHDARFMFLLTPEQRRRALKPAGLPFNELTPAQQQAAVDLLQRRDDESERQGGDPSPTPPEWWSHAEVTAQYVPAGWYAWTPPIAMLSTGHWDGPTTPFGGKTAAAALAAARQVYPAASPKDVQYCGGGTFGIGLGFRFPEPLKAGG